MQLEPRNAEILTHACEVFRRAARIEEAVAAARQAVQLRPDQPAPHNNLGLALQDAIQFAESESAFRQATRVDPTYARAYFNLGNVFRLQDRFHEAEACYGQALRLRPDYPEALNSAGQLLKDQGKPQAAMRYLERAIELRLGYPKARLNLANTLVDLDREQEAEILLRYVVADHPQYSEALHDLGALLEKQQRVVEAVQSYQLALTANPDSLHALVGLENARRHACDWRGWPQNVDQLIAGTRDCVARGKPSPLGPLVSCRFPTTSQDRLDIARQYARRIAARMGGVSLVEDADHKRLLRQADRLRIGFLSHEFRYHVVTHLMEGLYRRFDRQQFEIFAFDYSSDDGSEMRMGVRADVDDFVTIADLPPLEQAKQIAGRGVHILLDINSYMPGGRPEIAACRPAAICIRRPRERITLITSSLIIL